MSETTAAAAVLTVPALIYFLWPGPPAILLLSLTNAVLAVYMLLWRRTPPPPYPTFPPAKPQANVLARGLKDSELPKEADCIVIGAGPSGLALAVMLGRRGKRVLVLEQHNRAGGGLHTFEEKGFEFDTGFHYCGELRPGKELRAIVDNLCDGEVAFFALGLG